MKLSSNAWRIATGDQRRASHGTDRSIGKRVFEHQSMPGQLLDPRRLRSMTVKQLHVVHRIVFRDEPHKVWTIRTPDWGPKE